MSTAPAWDPQQYHRFRDLRLRPAVELFARVSLEDPRLVHDIGTGGGEISRLMAERWPKARVIGSDSSPEMLAKAQAVESTVEWLQLDLNAWRPDSEADLIFGSAVLHWLPDHDELFPRLMSGLVPGGQLAVQMPMSWWQPSHQAIRASLAALGTAESAALRDAMATPNVAQPDFYWQILEPMASAIDIWETTYQQALTGPDPVFEWISGSVLRPVIAGLPADQFEQFAADCRARLNAAYPPQPDGVTLFPFRRLFIVATR